MTEVTAIPQQAEEIQTVESKESFLTVLEKGQKPWFLTSTEVYKLVKGAVRNIPHSEELLNRSLTAIELLAKYVNESTRVKIAFDPDQTYDLVNRLDVILSEQLVAVDDGFDSVRARFCASLRGLIQALTQHREWTLAYAASQQEKAQQVISVRYQHSLLVLQLLLEQANNRFPKATKLLQDSVERAKATVENGKQLYKGEQSVQDCAAKLLTEAQPYVHQAVNYTRPVVERVIDASQPYYQRAAPYLAPLIDRAEVLEESLKENAIVGPYVTKAIDTSFTLFNHLVGYAIPPAVIAEPAEAH